MNGPVPVGREFFKPPCFSYARRVFRFWTGDDTDASVVIDEKGFLYVASELEKFNARSSVVGRRSSGSPTDRR